MVSSKQLLVVAVAAVVVLTPLTLFMLVFAPPGFMYSHYTTYSYTTTVSTNGTVENATILLPFPVGDDVGADPLSELWLYDDAGNRITDWDTAVVETPHGPMLRLHTDRLVGEDRYTLWTYAPNGSVIDRRIIDADEVPENMTNRRLVPEPTSYSVGWQVTVDHDIETRYPIGNGSFLAPVDNVTSVDCRDPWTATDVCMAFSTVASVTYESETPATVTLGEIRFEGWNEWGFGLSNSFNAFESSTTATAFTADRQGWTVLDGRLHAGMGRYDGPRR